VRNEPEGEEMADRWRKCVLALKGVAAVGVVTLLVLGVYVKVQRLTGIRTYNGADAQLVHKVEMAVYQDIPPDQMEQFVGAEATINTWREVRRDLDRLNVVSDPPASSTPINLSSATKVMAWPRPVYNVDNYPRMVGVTWDQNGKATVFAGCVVP
jgi:hypothetical protein